MVVTGGTASQFETVTWSDEYSSLMPAFDSYNIIYKVTEASMSISRYLDLFSSSKQNKLINLTIAEKPRSLEIEAIIVDEIKNSKDYPTVTDLWERLSEKIELTDFYVILRRLEDDDKIMKDKDGSIIWVYPDNSRIKRMLKESEPLD